MILCFPQVVPANNCTTLNISSAGLPIHHFKLIQKFIWIPILVINDLLGNTLSFIRHIIEIYIKHFSGHCTNLNLAIFSANSLWYISFLSISRFLLIIHCHLSLSSMLYLLLFVVTIQPWESLQQRKESIATSIHSCL